MKKRSATVLTVLVFVFICFSCTSTDEIMDSWIGSTEHEGIMEWGAPNDIKSDGNGGKIISSYGYFTINDTLFIQERDFYINQNGIVYHWRTEN